MDFIESLDRLFLKSLVRPFFFLTFLRELSKIPREGFF